MRSLGTAEATALTKLGTEPVVIIEVTWGIDGPTLSYADKDYDGIDGKILDISGIDAIEKLGSTGAAGSINVTLDDTDGSIKTLFDSHDIHKGRVRVYQSYESLTAADKFFLFEGEIETPIIWSEANQDITFSVVTDVEDKEVGFSPEQGLFDFIAESAIGKAWPLCFGSPIRVPAVKITEAVRGTSLTRYGVITLSELNQLCSLAEAVTDAEADKAVADTQLNPLTSDTNYATLVDALTSALISLNTFKESLIFDSPTQESNIESYITACKELRLNERNQETFAGTATSSEATITSTQATIQSLQAQIIAEQANDPVNPATLASLQASLLAAQQQLEDAQNENTSSLSNLSAAVSNISIFTSQKESLETQLLRINLTEIIVDGGENFPQGTETTIIINGLLFTGTFSGEVFTISNSNLPAETGVLIGSRQNDNENEFWLQDNTVDLKNKYCWFGDKLIYVTNQEGTRCFFQPIIYNRTGVLEVGSLIRETFDPILIGQSGYNSINQTSVLIRQEWLNNLRAQAATSSATPGVVDVIGNTSNPAFASGLSNVQDADYGIEIGDDVYALDNYLDTYVANLIPSTEVKEVFAYRTINGVRKLLPVPSRYYTVDLNESIAGQNATTIRFIRPLTGFQDEDWEEDIYVSLTSSEGPNTADIIEYLVTNYTDLSVDAASFASVNTSLTNYPSHFALLTRENALRLIENIAWQARCLAYVKQDTVYLKYLSAEEAAVQTLTESDIAFNTFEVTLTPTDQLVTKFVAKWTDDYSKEDENEVVLRNNIPRYGLIEEEYDFFIYNIESLVIKSATFWLIRYSNSWKIARFQAYLNTLKLETFDTVELDLQNNLVASDAIKGVVQNAVYDSENNVIEYEVQTEVRAGELTEYPFFWPATAPAGLEYPTENDPYAGGGE